MKKRKLLLISAVLGGIFGLIIGMFVGAGTNVLLPGLGLVISGSLFFGIVCGLIGTVLGFLLGLIIIAVKSFSRGKNLP